MFSPTSQDTSIINTCTGFNLHSFNGKEKDDEWNGTTGGALDFGDRIYDARVGRWLSCDKLQKDYPFLSPYSFCGDNPILFKDFDGKDFGVEIDETNNTITIKATYYTDNDAKTIEYAQAAATYINGFSDKYNYVDNNGKSYTIKFDITVVPRISENIKTDQQISKSNEEVAADDNTANFVAMGWGYPMYFNEGHPVFGTTLNGGDDISLADPSTTTPLMTELTKKENGLTPEDNMKRVATEEMLHSLGVSHKGMDRKKSGSITFSEKTVKGILKQASFNDVTNKFKFKNARKTSLADYVKNIIKDDRVKSEIKYIVNSTVAPPIPQTNTLPANTKKEYRGDIIKK